MHTSPHSVGSLNSVKVADMNPFFPRALFSGLSKLTNAPPIQSDAVDATGLDVDAVEDELVKETGGELEVSDVEAGIISPSGPHIRLSSLHLPF